jgi:hypothetical protein
MTKRVQGEGTKFLAYALGYAQKLGFRVIPLVPGQKTPLIPDWPNRATSDEGTICEWWSRWPDANIGIVTGRYRDGYFIVLDFDPRNGGDWWDDVGEDLLPPTWVVHTPSGGRHFYYKTTELVRCAKLPDGVDLRGEGGYVVAPPSILLDKDGNKVGEWGFQLGNMPKETALAVEPIEALQKLGWGRTESGLWVRGSGEKSGGGAQGGRSLWLMPPPIPKGMRHDYLVSLAGAFRAAGLTEKEIEAILWAGLELLETLDDFDPEREIPNIVKSLGKWEGETYTIGSLLRMLPERTGAVVRRVLTAGAVVGGAESHAVVGGQSEAKPSEAAEAKAAPIPEPPSPSEAQREAKTPPPTEAAGDATQSDAGGGKQKADTGGKDRFQAARDIVRAFEMRQRGDGSFCYVYRTPDGNELETASCDPKAVKEFFGRLGLNIPLKDVRVLLGLSKEADAGEGEGKSKRKRKAETAELDDIKAVLWRYRWVRWQGGLWQIDKPLMYKADLDRLHSVLKQNGLDVGKETLKSHMAAIMATLPKENLRGLVVTPEPTYGVVGNLRGLWYRHRGDLYLDTPNGTLIFPAGQWPEGVYALDTGEEGVLPDANGTIEHIVWYWKAITSRLSEKKMPLEKLQLVTLAMFLPVLFGQAHIGIILYGAARSGKSTLLKALGYLRLGRKPKSPSGIHKRDLLAVLQRKQIVFFDEVRSITPELDEMLRRMITHDGDEIRSLYTDFERVEADLEGSAIFCATKLNQLSSDLRTRCFVWELEEKAGAQYESEIIAFCDALWRLALGGAIKLYQQAARVKRPPRSLLPEIRFRDWLACSYRYAVVLGVEKEFIEYVKQSKCAAHSGGKYDFLLSLLAEGKIETDRPYTTTELIALAGTEEAQSLRRAIRSEVVRADLTAMARDYGYNLTIEKLRMKGEKKETYKLVFTKLQTPSDGNMLREILQMLNVKANLSDDDDDLPTPPNPPMPIERTQPPKAMPADLTKGSEPMQSTPTPEPTKGAEPIPTETKTLTDMVRAQNERTPQLGVKTTAFGQTEKNEDHAAMRFVMEKISEIEANGGGDAEVRRFVETYLRRFGDWLKERGCDATLSLLHHELQRLAGNDEPHNPNGGNTPPNPAAGTPKANPHPNLTAGKSTHKTDPKKAPPATEWVYRAGTPKDADAYGGIFTQQSAPQSEPKTNGHGATLGENEGEEDDDQAIKLGIEQKLIEFEKAQLPLTTRLDFLNRFLDKFGEEMKQRGLTRSYNFVVSQIKYLQAAINLRDEE